MYCRFSERDNTFLTFTFSFIFLVSTRSSNEAQGKRPGNKRILGAGRSNFIFGFKRFVHKFTRIQAFRKPLRKRPWKYACGVKYWKYEGAIRAGLVAW
jgi:hypothetical protein